MKPNDIIQQIAQRDGERLRDYRDMLDFYQGRQWPGRERWGEKRLTFNYARVFIDKLTSYLMSGINFTVEPAENTPEASALAEKAEMALRRVYQDNALEELDYETETDFAVLGDGCYKVTWDPREKRVRITAPDVQGIYAWWLGDDTSRVWRVASRYQLSREEVEMLYGKSGKDLASLTPASSRSEMQTLIEVWTDRDFELYLEGALMVRKPNPYGFIPFVIFPNLREPKKFWGISDLAQIVGPQRELNRAFSQVSHILELSGNPVAVLQNVEESSDIAGMPGAVWNLPEDAKAYLLDLLQGGGLDLHIKYIELLYRALHDISESPRAAFGGTDRNLSGVAMQIELYPLLQKVLRKRSIRTAVYNRRNRMVLRLLEKFNGESYGDNRLKVVWGQVLPQDRAALIENERVLVEAGIHSRSRAMDEVGVHDPEAELSRWIEEQKLIQGVKIDT